MNKPISHLKLGRWVVGLDCSFTTNILKRVYLWTLKRCDIMTLTLRRFDVTTLTLRRWRYNVMTFWRYDV